MCNGQIALDVGNCQGLRVLARRLTGGRVADMTNRHVALHAVQNLLVKDVVYQTNVLVAANHALIAHGDAAGLLTAVLKGEEGGVCLVCRAGRYAFG